jgi:hypothetical protein
MVEAHDRYDQRRLEKLRSMFDGDPRRGNPTLYVREHFNLRRICDHCGKRSSSDRLAVASVILEGSSWVLPVSIRHDGFILIDLDSSIPNQGNFFKPNIAAELAEFGIAVNEHGHIEYVVPIAPDRDAFFRSLRKNKVWDYKNARKHFACSVVTDISPDDVLTWDTEVEYDFEAHWNDTTGERSCGFNVETEYFQYLAEHGRLVVARISDPQEGTLALAYCVPEEYELSLVNYKRRTDAKYSKFGLGNALIFMLLDFVYERELLTPLSLGTILYQYKEIWSPVPTVKPRFEFSDRSVQQAIVDRFGGA